MAIVINGSGTVTGISVGGLPDGIVDAGTLATNSVDSAELIDGAVDDSHMAAMAASKLTGALPAISGASLTGLTAGSAGFAARSSGEAWVSSVSAGTFLAFNNDSTGDSFDTDSCYDTSTYKFTAPATGLYIFWFAMYTAQANSTNAFTFKINSTNMNLQASATSFLSHSSVSAADHVQSVSVIVNLTAADTVGVVPAATSDWYTGYSQWGGCRLK